MAAINAIAGIKKDFNVLLGDTWLYSFKVQDFNGNALNLTNAAVVKNLTMVIRDGADQSGKILFNCTLGNGFTISDDQPGDQCMWNINLLLKGAKQLPAAMYVQCKIEFVNGQEFSPLRGVLNGEQNTNTN